MSDIMNLVRSLTGARSHWVDPATGRSLCGRLRAAAVTGRADRNDLCTRCVLAMNRIRWADEILAAEWNRAWALAEWDRMHQQDTVRVLGTSNTDGRPTLTTMREQTRPEQQSARTYPHGQRWTTVTGEHFCSIMTEIGTHEGPCVELVDGREPVEDDVWAAMHQNAHLMRPTKVDTVRVPGTVAIHSVGELHMLSFPPYVPERVTFAYNLSDLLDDPAHKPDARLVALDGTDDRVQDFVFATDGALELYERIVGDIESQQQRGKDVVVALVCRGGRHRSVAFAENIAAHFDVTARHHHKHLDVVEKTDTGDITINGSDRLDVDLLALSEQIVRMGIESEEQLIDALRKVTQQ